MRRAATADAGKVVAVIGDGAMTGGVAFEAIHQAGGAGHADRRRPQRQRHVDRAERRRAVALLQPRPPATRSSGTRREGVEDRLTELPGGIGAAFERLGPQLKESIKAFWAPGLLWEELDWAYIGRHRRPRRARAARRAARGARGRAPGRRAHRDGQGQGLRARPRRAAWRAWRSGTPPSPSRSPTARPRRRRPIAAGRRPTPPPQYTQVFGEAMVARVPARPRASSASPPR